MSSTRALNATLWALLPALAACQPAGPPPVAPAAANTIRVDDPDGRLRGLEGVVRDTLESALARVTEALPLDGVTLTLKADPGRTIQGYGVGGFTPDAQTVQLYLDPGFPDIARLIPTRLSRAVAHELHHARRRRGPGYGKTLFEALVTEGLADHFAIELLGLPVPPWSDALPREETARLLDLARPEFDSAGYSHPGWFFLTGPSRPRWTGYTLGYRLVEAYQAQHPGATAAQLVDTPASAFRPR